MIRKDCQFSRVVLLLLRKLHLPREMLMLIILGTVFCVLLSSQICRGKFKKFISMSVFTIDPRDQKKKKMLESLYFLP